MGGEMQVFFRRVTGPIQGTWKHWGEGISYSGLFAITLYAYVPLPSAPEQIRYA